MLKDLSLFQMAQQRIDWAGQRQQVLARNIANADTPNYKPSDIQEPDFKQALSQVSATLAPTVTDPHHIATMPMGDPLDVVKVKHNETSPDGNAVVLEQQIQYVGDTKQAFDTATTLFQKHLKMLESAIGHS